MILTIVRHGETIENKLGIRQGHLPGKLSRLGKSQAKKLALKLKDEKFDAVFSSDLARAADTAKEILNFHKNTPVFYVEELREFNNGILQGKKRSETKNIDWENPPKGVEKKDEGLKRAANFIEEIFKKYKGKKVLFVTHGYFTKALVTAIRNKDISHFEELESFENTSISVFEMNDRKNPITKKINDTSHLDKFEK